MTETDSDITRDYDSITRSYDSITKSYRREREVIGVITRDYRREREGVRTNTNNDDITGGYN